MKTLQILEHSLCGSCAMCDMPGVLEMKHSSRGSLGEADELKCRILIEMFLLERGRLRGRPW